MNIILACSSYWNDAREFDARYEGVWLTQIDPRTGNNAYMLDPAYRGKFGLRQWYSRNYQFFHPQHAVIACGTWSDPNLSRFGQLVTVVNAGVEPDRPHSNHWQYMGCAFTALMAYMCNRRDWDLLAFIDTDLLLGAVNWDELVHTFMDRPELVLGPRWYDRHCDFILWKRAAVVKYLHSRIRPNLSDDTSLMWIDDELHRMFAGQAWNPWPTCHSIRQDHPHLASPRVPNDEVMNWPMVRLPDPAIIDRYEAECTALATPVKGA